MSNIGDHVYSTYHDISYRKLNKENEPYYLYHYCSFDKALKILITNSLRFSNLNNLNDTTECKPKIHVGNENYKNILNFCNNINNYINICCFSTDDTSIEPHTKNSDFYPNDYLGRGFALARMWAQYSSDNTGVCLIFNRIKLLKLIDNRTHWNKLVKYCNYKQPVFKFNAKIISDYNITQQKKYRPATFKKFLCENDDYIDYNYFYKLKDWENEHEFRIILFNDIRTNTCIENISGCLEGIIVGEKIDATNRHVLQKVLKLHNYSKYLKIATVAFKSNYISLIN